MRFLSAMVTLADAGDCAVAGNSVMVWVSCQIPSLVVRTNFTQVAVELGRVVGPQFALSLVA